MHPCAIAMISNYMATFATYHQITPQTFLLLSTLLTAPTFFEENKRLVE